MASLNEAERAQVRDIAFEAARVIADEVKVALATEIRLHAAECPTTKKVAEITNKGKGAWAVLVLVSSVLGAVAALAAQHYFFP